MVFMHEVETQNKILEEMKKRRRELRNERKKEEREAMRGLIHSLEQLVDYGGFIKEAVEETVFNFYPPGVAINAEKYSPIGPGFCYVADRVEDAYFDLERYSDYYFDEESEPCEESNPEFVKWAIDQVARIETEKYKCAKTEPFWKNWDLSRETKNALKKLNALDERVLYLSCGMGKADKLTAGEIAKLSEFSCDAAYIERVLETIEDTMGLSEWGGVEFMHICETQRTR